MKSPHQGLALLSLGAAALLFVFVIVPHVFAVRYSPARNDALARVATGTPDVPLTDEKAEPPKASHIEIPKAVKAVYMTACAASTPSFKTHFMGLLDETELNSIVIDIKDYSGTISFPTDNPMLQDGVSGPGCKVKDMRELVQAFHDRGVYIIGRITVFQDPHYSKLHPDQAVQHADGSVWKDRKGLAFVDVGSRQYWDYIATLAKESYALGFDELNFDYVRFPSDGNISSAVFTRSVALGKTKAGALKEFFVYLDRELAGTGIVTSADLFGMTTTAQDDMGIGQVLENAMPYFDYIAPMVYPSHYPPNFNGWKDVNAPSVVGPLIQFVMTSAVEREHALYEKVASSTPDAPYLSRLKPTQMRPWLQDEDYPVTYTAAMVRAQIQGAYDAGLNSWMLWDAGNKYTRSALLPE